MKIYNIYAGLGGGFGGVSFQHSEEFESQEDADEYAREVAFKEYDSYGGLHGLSSYDEVEDEYREENDIDADAELDEMQREDIQDRFNEIVEGWVSYYAVLPENDKDWDFENNCSNL